ncbi:MAG: hypothetical protein ABL871_05820 [Terricaulis sp.]
MKRILLSLALALAPAVSSCVSTPGYGDWVIADYCGNHLYSNTLAWSRTGAPADVQRYRDIARADQGTVDLAGDDPREFWFAGPGGEIKYCLTNLQRGGHHNWCDARSAAWWVFRETETGLAAESNGFGLCLT